MTHTKDEALKLALEALEKYCTPYQDGTHPADEAITAIKQALAAPVPLTSESAQGVEQDERVFARIAAMKKPPAAQPAPVPLTEQEFEALHWKAKGYVATGLMDVVRIVETHHGITKGQP